MRRFRAELVALALVPTGRRHRLVTRGFGLRAQALGSCELFGQRRELCAQARRLASSVARAQRRLVLVEQSGEELVLLRDQKLTFAFGGAELGLELRDALGEGVLLRTGYLEQGAERAKSSIPAGGR